MSNKQKGWLAAIIALVVLTVPPILSSFLQRMPENPEGTVGNSAGNLNNKGLFCETSDKIYFANAYDNYRLYSMNKDETEITRLTNVSVEYLCAGGNYLYYHQSSSEGGVGLGYIRSISGLYRMNLKRNSIKGLSREGSNMLQLINNEIYYHHYTKSEGVSLYAASTDGKSNSLVLKEADAISPACVWNNKLYFTYTAEKRGLYVLDPITKSISLCMEGNIWFPQIQDGYVYYIDADNDYRLCRFLLSDTEPSIQLLTSDRVDTFLVFGDMIYYQKNHQSEPALKRMSLDGSNPEIVMEGNYKNLNGAAGYVYFSSFHADTPVYRTPAFGSISVSEFEGAKTAALKHLNE